MKMDVKSNYSRSDNHENIGIYPNTKNLDPFPDVAAAPLQDRRPRDEGQDHSGGPRDKSHVTSTPILYLCTVCLPNFGFSSPFPQRGRHISKYLPTLVKAALPDRSPEEVSVLTQGIRPSNDTPLQWMAEHLSYPDNFLYLIVEA